MIKPVERIYRMTHSNGNLDQSDFWKDETIPENTPMRDFYRGKVIFLTGGTGFLGQIYVEKLLR